MEWTGVAAICVSIIGSVLAAAFVADRRLTKVESSLENLVQFCRNGFIQSKEEQEKLANEKAILESKVGKHGEALARVETTLSTMSTCAARLDEPRRRGGQGSGKW